ADAYDDASTILHPKFDPSPVAPNAYGLVVVQGPDTGSRFILDGQEPSRVLLGQSPACTFRLTDPAVSRRHAALDIVANRLRITDLGSKNGTFVDGVSVLDAHLDAGSTVRLGATALRIEAVAPQGGARPSLPTGFGRLVGTSTEMRRLYPLCERLAASDVVV